MYFSCSVQNSPLRVNEEKIPPFEDGGWLPNLLSWRCRYNFLITMPRFRFFCFVQCTNRAWPLYSIISSISFWVPFVPFGERGPLSPLQKFVFNMRSLEFFYSLYCVSDSSIDKAMVTNIFHSVFNGVEYTSLDTGYYTAFIWAGPTKQYMCVWLQLETWHEAYSLQYSIHFLVWNSRCTTQLMKDIFFSMVVGNSCFLSSWKSKLSTAMSQYLQNEKFFR